MRTRRLGAVPVVVVALAVTSCSGSPAGPDAVPSSASSAGSSSSAGDADPAVVAAGLARVYRGDHSTPDGRREARCFADGLLERVDLDALVSAGVVGADGRVARSLPVLDRDLAEQWVLAQEQCVTFLDASTEALSAQTKGRLDAARYRRCLGAALTADEVRGAQVDALSGEIDSPGVQALTDAQSRCTVRALPAG